MSKNLLKSKRDGSTKERLKSRRRSEKPKSLKLDRNKSDKTKSEKLKVDKSRTPKGDRPRTPKSDKPKTPRTGRSKTYTFITDKSKTDKSKNDKSKTDKSKTDKSKTDKSKTDKSKTEKSKTDKSKTDKSKTDKSKTDKSKTGKSKTDKFKTDKSKTDKSSSNRSSSKEKKGRNTSQEKKSRQNKKALTRRKSLPNSEKEILTYENEELKVSVRQLKEKLSNMIERRDTLQNQTYQSDNHMDKNNFLSTATTISSSTSTTTTTTTGVGSSSRYQRGISIITNTSTTTATTTTATTTTTTTTTTPPPTTTTATITTTTTTTTTTTITTITTITTTTTTTIIIAQDKLKSKKMLKRYPQRDDNVTNPTVPNKIVPETHTKMAELELKEKQAKVARLKHYAKFTPWYLEEEEMEEINILDNEISNLSEIVSPSKPYPRQKAFSPKRSPSLSVKELVAIHRKMQHSVSPNASNKKLHPPLAINKPDYSEFKLTITFLETQIRALQKTILESHHLRMQKPAGFCHIANAMNPDANYWRTKYLDLQRQEPSEWLFNIGDLGCWQRDENRPSAAHYGSLHRSQKEAVESLVKAQFKIRSTKENISRLETQLNQNGALYESEIQKLRHEVLELEKHIGPQKNYSSVVEKLQYEVIQLQQAVTESQTILNQEKLELEMLQSGETPNGTPKNSMNEHAAKHWRTKYAILQQTQILNWLTEKEDITQG